jgi:uncharacterized protein with FMN-binding domain
MKRALLIATGTVGGLGAVLAVTPPQFTSTENSSLAMAGIGAPASTATAQSATQTQTPAVNTPAPAPIQTTKSVSGIFTGDSVDVKYGFVQVKITVVNGKITEAQAVQAPSGRNDRWTQMSVPVLRQQTLTAQSANITGASGASYTSYGWYTSLASALAKAGL